MEKGYRTATRLVFPFARPKTTGLKLFCQFLDTRKGGRRNLASKSAMRGHSTRGSLRSLMTRLARHRFRPHLLLYGLSLLPAVFRVKSEEGRHRVGYLRSFLGAEDKIGK